MYHEQIAKKTSPALTPKKPIQKKNIPTRSSGSLSGTIQRAIANPETIREKEWLQIGSAIGVREANEIKTGKRTSWEPDFKGISAQWRSETGQNMAPVQAKRNIGEGGGKSERSADRDAAEEVQGKHNKVELQLKPVGQRRADAVGEANTDIESDINSAEMRGSSQGLDTGLKGVTNKHVTGQQQPIQKKSNKTGLPDKLKTGIEHISGYSMDDVKVHYNSSKPAQLQAHAYAQGREIHIAPGQEKHLPHEAWHVVQQKQGRVKPTTQMKGNVNINDDKALEKEADVMGRQTAHQFGQKEPVKESNNKNEKDTPFVEVVQCKSSEDLPNLPSEIIGRQMMFKSTTESIQDKVKEYNSIEKHDVNFKKHKKLLEDIESLIVSWWYHPANANKDHKRQPIYELWTKVNNELLFVEGQIKERETEHAKTRGNVIKIDDLARGDLLFLEDKSEVTHLGIAAGQFLTHPTLRHASVTHVGMADGQGNILESSGAAGLRVMKIAEKLYSYNFRVYRYPNKDVAEEAASLASTLIAGRNPKHPKGEGYGGYDAWAAAKSLFKRHGAVDEGKKLHEQVEKAEKRVKEMEGQESVYIDDVDLKFYCSNFVAICYNIALSRRAKQMLVGKADFISPQGLREQVRNQSLETLFVKVGTVKGGRAIAHTS